MSIELDVKPGAAVGPQYILYLDSGDGYFSISWTAEKHDELSFRGREEFFNSLALR